MGYPMPGMWVEEHTLRVPLDWSSPDGEDIDLFVRELVGPEKRREDLPLLLFLQGGPGARILVRPVPAPGSRKRWRITASCWWTSAAQDAPPRWRLKTSRPAATPRREPSTCPCSAQTPSSETSSTSAAPSSAAAGGQPWGSPTEAS